MTMTWTWRRKEQLPDGRWQHYCIRCNAPHTEERLFESDFKFEVMCEDCIKKEPPTFNGLTRSRWE